MTQDQIIGAIIFAFGCLIVAAASHYGGFYSRDGRVGVGRRDNPGGFWIIAGMWGMGALMGLAMMVGPWLFP